MELETQRLLLIPLTAAQLSLWAEDLPALERELCCVYRAEPVGGVLGRIVRGQVEPVAADPEHALYHTFWFLLRKADRVVVGSADFKRPPDEAGQVEIGYGLGKEFEGNGYMTECVTAMCRWALEQPGVTHVIAETEAENTASQRVLQRCGFSFYQREENLWWRL